MTWIIKVTKSDGSLPEGKNTCEACKHNVSMGKAPWTPCNIPKMQWPLANLLTSVDNGADGHMAAGEAVLKCYGFEQKEEAQPEGAATA